MPTTATATALVATTVVTGPTALATAMDSTTARGRLRLSPRLMPTTDTDGLVGYYGGYRTYGLGYGYGHGLYYGKREAEAEPYHGYAAHAVAPVVSTYAAAPVVSHAVAPVAVSHAVHAVAPVVSSYAQVSPSASLSTVGIAPAAIPAVGGAYAGAGRYVANSAGTVH